MVNLEIEDRKQLITLLKDLPELTTERSRQQILELESVYTIYRSYRKQLKL